MALFHFGDFTEESHDHGFNFVIFVDWLVSLREMVNSRSFRWLGNLSYRVLVSSLLSIDKLEALCLRRFGQFLFYRLIIRLVFYSFGSGMIILHVFEVHFILTIFFGTDGTGVFKLLVIEKL